MNLFIFLMVVQALVAASLVGVILIQRSEGGGLGIGGGGSPGGLMSARGAADFLTRATAILAVAFVVLSIVLAAVATSSAGTRELDNTLEREVDPLAQSQAGQPAQAPQGEGGAAAGAVPAQADPLAGVTE